MRGAGIRRPYGADVSEPFDPGQGICHEPNILPFTNSGMRPGEVQV